MVDFACDQDGSPILAVSSLAIHSKVRYFYVSGIHCKAIHIYLFISKMHGIHLDYNALQFTGAINKI